MQRESPQEEGLRVDPGSRSSHLPASPAAFLEPDNVHSGGKTQTEEQEIDGCAEIEVPVVQSPPSPCTTPPLAVTATPATAILCRCRCTGVHKTSTRHPSTLRCGPAQRRDMLAFSQRPG